MSAWWWPLAPADADARPVLFLPPAGADQTVVTPLLPYLAGMPLAVLRMPGRGVRREEAPPTEAEPLLDQLSREVAALPGPAPLLVGHSFGAVLAAALAGRLEHHGTPVARLVVVAATPPRRREPSWDPWDSAAVAQRVHTLLANGAVPPEIERHPELGTRVRADLATDVRLSWTLPTPVPLSTPVTFVNARDDTLVDPTAADGWRALAAGEFLELPVRGGHFFYRARPGVLAGILRGELDSLDGAYSTG